MLVCEITEMNNPKTEVLNLITMDDVKCLLTEELEIKKSDYPPEFWDEIISRSRKSILNHFTRKLIKDVIGKELAEFVREDPLPP